MNEIESQVKIQNITQENGEKKGNGVYNKIVVPKEERK